MQVEPLVLQRDHVRLVPLALEHVPALFKVGGDPAIWAWTPIKVRSADDMRSFVEDALNAQRAGTALPFAITERESGSIVGSTGFMSIDRANRRVEIGGTWISPTWQRTHVNAESKYLLLQHAFETWHCQRVELKTHARNSQSRAAILRIGAVEEGTLRKHMLYPDGSIRDSVYFSIVDDEWPNVRARLEAMLAR